jgi:hypothetical protein
MEFERNSVLSDASISVYLLNRFLTTAALSLDRYNAPSLRMNDSAWFESGQMNSCCNQALGVSEAIS